MEKNLVLSRLGDTIEKLKALSPSQFYYGNYVSKMENGCGTMCCVMGWYPTWFPDAGLSYIETTDVNRRLAVSGETSTIEKSRLLAPLIEWHGISMEIMNGLFYGASMNLELCSPVHIVLAKRTGISISTRYIQLAAKAGLQTQLPDVIDLFEKIYDLIENDAIVYAP